MWSCKSRMWKRSLWPYPKVSGSKTVGLAVLICLFNSRSNSEEFQTLAESRQIKLSLADSAKSWFGEETEDVWVPGSGRIPAVALSEWLCIRFPVWDQIWGTGDDVKTWYRSRICIKSSTQQLRRLDLSKQVPSDGERFTFQMQDTLKLTDLRNVAIDRKMKFSSCPDRARRCPEFWWSCQRQRAT